MRKVWLTGAAGMALRAGAMVAGMAMAATPALADDDGAAVAARFGALQDFRNVALSPDGTKVALVRTVGDGMVLLVADLAAHTPAKPIIGMPAKEGRISGCSWSTDTRLVCRNRYVTRQETIALLGFTRMFAINADGTGVVKLTQENNYRSRYAMEFGGGVIDYDVGDAPGAVLMTRQFVPDDKTGSMLGSKQEGNGVELVDTLTLKRKTVEPPRKDATEFISDGHGNVRVLGVLATDPDGLLKGKTRYLYRKPGSRDWEPLSTVVNAPTGISTGFDPYAVDSARNVVFGFDDKNGYSALYSVSLDGAATRTEVLARPDTDIDELVQIGRDHRVVGASYALERREVEYFDPELKKSTSSMRARVKRSCWSSPRPIPIRACSTSMTRPATRWTRSCHCARRSKG